MASSELPVHARSSLQRSVAARYDGFHAFLVRLVHPLCYGAFVLTAAAIAFGVGYVVLGSGSDDAIGVGLSIIVMLFLAVKAVFSFVLTPWRARLGLLLLGGWTIALIAKDDLDTKLLWTIWIIAAFSILVQVVLLVRAVPDRIRNGLLHLMWPATLGTIAGAVPVALGASALLKDDMERAHAVAAASYLAGGIVLLVLAVLQWYGRRGDEGILTDFAEHEGLTFAGHAYLDTPNVISPLVPGFALSAGPYRGTTRGREAVAMTGYTSSSAPDLPSAHLTVLAISCAPGGRDLWVRSRSKAHDNVLVSLDRSEVVRFESLALDERYSIRFPAGTEQMTAYLTIGPQVLDLLATQLGAAQACRVGSTVYLFTVGGVLDAAELEAQVETAIAFAELLEKADAAERRDPAIANVADVTTIEPDSDPVPDAPTSPA